MGLRVEVCISRAQHALRESFAQQNSPPILYGHCTKEYCTRHKVPDKLINREYRVILAKSDKTKMRTVHTNNCSGSRSEEGVLQVSVPIRPLNANL